MSATLCFTSFCFSSQKSLPVLIASSKILPTLSLHPGNRNRWWSSILSFSQHPFSISSCYSLCKLFRRIFRHIVLLSSLISPDSLPSFSFASHPPLPSCSLFATTFVSTSYFFSFSIHLAPATAVFSLAMIELQLQHPSFNRLVSVAIFSRWSFLSILQSFFPQSPISLHRLKSFTPSKSEKWFLHERHPIVKMWMMSRYTFDL